VLISDERLEKSLKKLAMTDDLSAALHMKAERAEFRAKAVREAVFLRSEGNVAERQALGTVSPEYKEAMDEYFGALQAYDTIKNERAREVLIIDIWRSLNSARGKGLL